LTKAALQEIFEMDTRRREQDANPYRLQPIPTESMDFATQMRGSDYNNNQGPNFTTTQTTHINK
jgi:hypothetical protein